MMQSNNGQLEAAVPFQSLQQIQMNVKKALEFVMGDSSEEMLNEMSSIFLEDAIPLMNQMKNSYNSQDFQAVSMAAHALKGSSATIGLDRFADLCLVIEVNSKKQLVRTLGNHISCLETEYTQVQKALSSFLKESSTDNFLDQGDDSTSNGRFSTKFSAKNVGS